MRKIASYIVLVCFTVYSSGIAWAAPKIPPVDSTYVETITNSITLTEENKVTINYDDILDVLESYTGTLPEIKAPKISIPRNPKLPDIKIEIGGCVSAFGMPEYFEPDTTYICNASEFVGKKVSVTFEAGDEESKAIMDAYPSILDIPYPADLNVITTISVDDEPRIVGAPFNIMKYQYISTSILSDTGEWKLESSKILKAGARYNIYFGLGETLKTAKTMLEDLETELESYQDPEVRISDETLDNFLHVLNYYYFALMGCYREYTASLMDVEVMPTLSIGYANRGAIQLYSHIDPGNIILDVHLLGMDIEGSDELKFRDVFGGFSTNLESFAIETLTDTISVSTGRIFAEAAKQGIPFHVVDPVDNTDFFEIMSSIEMHGILESIVYDYIYPWNEDRIAICTESRVSVNGSSTEGVILYDKNTGRAKYLLAGNINGGASTTVFEGTSGKILGAVGKSIEFIDAIVVGSTTALAGGTHLYSAAILVNAFAGEAALPVVVGFAGIGALIGVAIIGAGIVITLQLLNNLHMACALTTRRGSYYV